MSEQMEFPETFESFAKEYGFNDHRHIYTNGSDLIPIFRVKQWLEHDNKLRRIETDTAYECGKNASKWISVKDRMPKDGEWVLCQLDDEFYDENTMMVLYHTNDWGEKWVDGGLGTGSYDVCAWMPLPKPYKEDNNG
jgi:hypothetical protein